MLSIQERLSLLTEPIEGAAWQWACALRSSIPGIVKSFDPVKQTCVVQPVIQEIVLLPPPVTAQVPNPGSTQNIPTTVSIEPIQDVPIVMMRVPGWSITLPITEGTECLLVFSDMCIDGWWQSSQVSPPFDRRRHDLSDAIAIFGPWSQPNTLSDYSTDSIQIRSDDKSVIIELTPTNINITAPDQITISAPTVQINASTQAIIQAALTELMASGGTPLPLINNGLMAWITSVLLPALAAHSITVAAPPSTVVTTTVKAQ
jgi:Phage protein Gp138 N-terminal domain